ncbi:MAG: DUF1573 domain-containing protein [candidate division Zixibacteria bacterium]|nr:DUF1573 domain-containing protein [candidate division Zixibacteria bacterium]
MPRLTSLLIILLLSVSAFAQTEPFVSVSHPTVNFGYISQAGEYSRKITLKSNISDTLIIENTNTYCPCVTASYNKTTLYPGDSIILELKLRPKNLTGKIYKVTHIYVEGDIRIASLPVKGIVYKNSSNFETIFVEPANLNFSQFGDKGIDEADFYIHNASDETVPLELLFTNTEYFELDFPVYVEPNKKVKGTVKLTEKGKSNEFGESFTFKFINARSEEYLFSVSATKKFFKGKSEKK